MQLDLHWSLLGRRWTQHLGLLRSKTMGRLQVLIKYNTSSPLSIILLKAPFTKTKTKQTRLTSVSFYSHKRHTVTYTCIYSGDTGHTRTRRPEVAVNVISAFLPSWTVLPPAPPRSSGQPLGAWGPSQVISLGQGQTALIITNIFKLCYVYEPALTSLALPVKAGSYT